METCKFLRRLILAILLMPLFSCEKEEEPIIIEDQNPLIGIWQYREIIVNDYGYYLASNTLEPGQYKDNLGGERAELARRYIQYFADGTYQLQWADRGDYSLGTEGDPNWQPSYGYYQLNEAGDSLYHNKGLPYECHYSIKWENEQMYRSSRRYMSTNSTEYSPLDRWRRGNIVEFVEHFQSVNNSANSSKKGGL